VTLQVLSGSGSQDGPRFTVPSRSNGWTISWSYDCESYGSDGSFKITIVGLFGSAAPEADVNEFGDESSGTERYYDTGTFELETTSQCSWSYAVESIPA